MDILSLYNDSRVSVVSITKAEQRTQGRKEAALAWGCHKSALEYIVFWRKESTDMIKSEH